MRETGTITMPWRMPRHGSPMPPADWPSSTVDQMALNRPHRGARADRPWSSYAPPSPTGSPHCRAGQADRYRNPGDHRQSSGAGEGVDIEPGRARRRGVSGDCCRGRERGRAGGDGNTYQPGGVGAADRDSTYIDDGDALRKRAAAVVTDIIGIEPPNITVTWEDIVLPSY